MSKPSRNQPKPRKTHSTRRSPRSSRAASPAPTEAPPPLSYVERANQYAKDVVAKRILACKWVRLACLRHLNDLRASRKADFPYVFDEAKARLVCLFIEHLPHTKGKWAIDNPDATNLIRLEPWQLFIVCAIFGWVHRSSGLRRFRRAYIKVPRKNGKSILAAAIGNYMLCADGEFGAEVYSGATSRKQAWEVFRPAKQQFERTDRMRDRFGVRVNAESLVIEANGSRFEPLIGKPGDGASPSMYIGDEVHEQPDDSQMDAMETGMGAREQPLAFYITTAGTDLASPCYSIETGVQKILDGTMPDETTFGVMYGIDEEDDWTSEESLRKANPNYGVSVLREYLLSRLAEAIRNSRKQNIFKTKHLNVWCNANVAWMNMQRWHAQADRKLTEEQFAGEFCVIAGDFSNKIDLTALVKLFRRTGKDGKDHFYAFPTFFLPEDRAEDPEKQHYQGWVHDKKLIATDGSAIDWTAVQDAIVDDVEKYRIHEFAFDGWQAAKLAQDVGNACYVTPVEVPNHVKYLSDPMKSLEALVLDGRLHHPGHPVLDWCISNVVAHIDKKENIWPDKQKPENKIDGAVAMIMALSRAMVAAPQKTAFEPFFLD